MQPETTSTLASPHQGKDSMATTTPVSASKRVEIDFALEEQLFKRQRLHGYFLNILSTSNSVVLTKFCSALEEIITVIAGVENSRTTFYVHKRVLCAPSPFFQAACKVEWMKPEEKAIKLTEDSPEAVRAMIYWMYHNKVSIPKNIYNNTVGKSAKDSMKTGWGLFAQLFALAEKYQIRQLKNRCMDAILCYEEKEVIDFGVVPFIYGNTPLGSPPRRIFVEMAVKEMTMEGFDEQRDKLACAEFSLDLLFEIIKHKAEDEVIFAGFEELADNFCEKFHVHLVRSLKCKTPNSCLIISLEDF